MAVGGYGVPVGPEAEFVEEIRKLQARLDNLERAPLRIPLLAADPPETDPTNFWFLPDGRLRGRHRNTGDTAWVYREWISTTAGSGSSGTAPAPPTSAPVSRSAQWAATWSASYRQAGPKRTDEPKRVYWGSSGDTFNGRNRAQIGFDYTAIAAALAGSTVARVRLVLQSLHTYYSSANIGFGYHNQTAAPSSWVGGTGILSTQTIGKTQTKTFDLPLSFGTALRDGGGKGVTLEAPNSSREWYGYAVGYGGSGIPPTLVIDYAK